jgi:hypothetical protein
MLEGTSMTGDAELSKEELAFRYQAAREQVIIAVEALNKYAAGIVKTDEAYNLGYVARRALMSMNAVPYGKRV